MTESSAQTRSPHFSQGTTVETYVRIQLPRVFVPWARVLLELVPPRPGDAVLDVATGPGSVAREAARLVGAGGRVTGLDMSAAMLAAGRAWPAEPGAAPIEYVESPAASMPLPDNVFDAAYCQQGLQHMSDPLAALREMRRVLKPGGRLGVALWTQSPFGRFREITAEMGLQGEGPQPSGFGRDSTQLAEALGEVGFQDVKVQNRQLVAVLEGGVAEALQLAQATSGGALLAGLPDTQRQAVREAFARAMEHYVQPDGSVHLPSASNIASAHTAR
jgi:ubiquinone/menaquinone biosynthesis C-methylase UbiE